MVYRCNGLFLSHKNEVFPFATIWMDLKVFTLSEISQREKEQYHMILIICGLLKKKVHRYRELICICQRWRVGMGKEVNRHRYKFSVLK